MQMELFDVVDRQLADVCTAADIRQIEASHDAARLWQTLVDSGFMDLLVSEDHGGAGLGWGQAWEVLFAAGRHGVCVPFGQTLFARACLADLGRQIDPDVPVAISGFGRITQQGSLRVPGIIGAQLAGGFLLQAGETVYFAHRAQCELESIGGVNCLDANVVVSRPEPIGSLAESTISHGLALVLAAQLAGVSDRVMQMTLTYANERSQFGKPIGRFQAVQQQITEMAELVYGARMASQLGCQSSTWQPHRLQAALAKSQTSATANRIASIAHAVHGAIGVTWEYDLQIYTRKLREWARGGGGAQYWAAQLGQAAIASDSGLLDFVRQEVFGSNRLDLPAV